MKKIDAIIRKSKFEEVKLALYKVDVKFFSFWDVTSTGNGQNIDSPKTYISIVVNDGFEEVTIKTILKSGKTGETGDGRVFVSSINDAYKIKTGEKGGHTLN
jgi:nitrogen regulatory protein P-II 1